MDIGHSGDKFSQTLFITVPVKVIICMLRKIPQFLNAFLYLFRVASGACDHSLFSGYFNIMGSAQHFPGYLSDIKAQLTGDINAPGLKGQVFHPPAPSFSIFRRIDTDNIHISPYPVLHNKP